MEEGQASAVPPTPELPEAAPRNSKRLVVIIIVAVVLVTGIAAAVIMSRSKSDKASLGSADAQALFYDMLATAAGKKTAHLTYAERYYTSKADFKDDKIGSELYSVAEYNAATNDYRAVYTQSFATSLGQYYQTVRCLNGNAFLTPEPSRNYDSLDAVRRIVEQPLPVQAKADSREAESCVGGSDNRKGRVSDGIIPLGLTETQIQGWLDRLKESNAVTVQDKGATQYEGKPVRKIALTSSSLAGAFQFFHDLEEGAHLQLAPAEGATTAPDAGKFDEMATTDNIQGFYLIDEATKLPVYSEFTAATLLSTGEDNPRQSGMKLKQTYSYPATLSMSQTTKLVILE